MSAPASFERSYASPVYLPGREERFYFAARPYEQTIHLLVADPVEFESGGFLTQRMPLHMAREGDDGTVARHAYYLDPVEAFARKLCEGCHVVALFLQGLRREVAPC